MARFTFMGMLFRTASRTLKSVNTAKITPSRNTAVRANCQECPIPMTTVYAKNAFRPMPGASANGRFAHRAITRMAIAEESAVAVNTEPASMPASARISGFTTRM